jgi:uncharacterized protein YndB with AHSA1/START domain
MHATETTTFTAAPGSSQVITDRLLSASPEKVFKALTDPELIAQWWGPRRLATVIEQYEPRRGGQWRFVHTDDDGNEFGFRGVIHEIGPELITQTFEFDGMPGHTILEQMTITPEGEGTRIHGVSAFTSVEDRDGMVSSGMEGGLTESHDRLQELLDRI